MKRSIFSLLVFIVMMIPGLVFAGSVPISDAFFGTTFLIPRCDDADGDGYGNPVSVACEHQELDCDDSNPDTYPGAVEICDGLDNDCNGSPDTNERDKDQDGWMICENDCDDAEPAVNPGAEESEAAGNCGDGLDNDCDNTVDAADPDCGATCFLSVVN